MRRSLIWAGCLILAMILGISAVSLSSRGHPVTLPLDDAYIYLQYARTALSGHFGEYFPGEGRSAGATSPLWLVLTSGSGLLHQISGVPLEQDFPLTILILSTLIAALTFHLGLQLSRTHGVGAVGVWTMPIICLLTPTWMFGMMNGMETGLFAAALLGGACTLSGGSPGWLAFLALVRPEGAVLALLILAATRVRDRRRDAPAPKRGWIGVALVWVSAAFTLAFPWLLTGGPASAWPAKALLVEPDPDIRGFYLSNMPYFALRVFWFGLSGGQVQPGHEVAASAFLPGSWHDWFRVAFLAGGALLALVTRRARTALVLWAAASLTALISAAWDAQFYRYLVPAYPLLVVTAIAGWFSRPVLLWRGAGAALVLLIGIASLITGDLERQFTWLYRGEAERMASNQIRVGDWLEANTPGTARVATHDVGAIAYAGERPIVDLVGLVSPALAGAYRHGEGALWEALDALPEADRPTHAAVVPAWMPYLSRTSWAGTRLWGVGAPASRPVSQDFEVWELSWPRNDFGSVPRNYGPSAGQDGWVIIDAVDVADLRSEHEHAYRGEVSETPTVVRNLGFAPVREPRSTAMEGGRDVLGTVEFRFRNVRAAPALLILRSASARDQKVTVHAGTWSDTLFIPKGEIRFRESAILIPTEATRSAVGGELPVRVEGTGYRAFHWWLLHPETGDPQP